MYLSCSHGVIRIKTKYLYYTCRNSCCYVVVVLNKKRKIIFIVLDVNAMYFLIICYVVFIY